MKLEKAQKIIGSNGLCDAGVTWGDYLKAVQIGREAIKMVIEQRQTAQRIIHRPLPGETKD